MTDIEKQLALQHRVSTDPNWCKPPDGRHLRRARTRAALLAAARGFMLIGHFRPTMAMVCREAKCAMRTGFHHFGDIDSLLIEALKLPGVAEHIGILTLSRSPEGIARLVVLGRAE